MLHEPGMVRIGATWRELWDLTLLLIYVYSEFSPTIASYQTFITSFNIGLWNNPFPEWEVFDIPVGE